MQCSKVRAPLFALVYALSGFLNIIRTILLPNLGALDPVVYWLYYVPLALILMAGAPGVKRIALPEAQPDRFLTKVVVGYGSSRRKGDPQAEGRSDD